MLDLINNKFLGKPTFFLVSRIFVNPQICHTQCIIPEPLFRIKSLVKKTKVVVLQEAIESIRITSVVIPANSGSFHDDTEHWIVPYHSCSAMVLVDIVAYLRHTATCLVKF